MIWPVLKLVISQQQLHHWLEQQFALVQSSSTKVATVANIGDVLSNSFVTKTLYASTSGAYTTVQSSSATWDGVY